ncbi:MAG: chemotaxis protein CheX [Negativicutes bacterium]
MNQYFGHYLLNKGILTHTQLAEVLQRERNAKVKLGLLAINAGLMTAAQVEEVHLFQRVKDQKFGILAEQQGYVTSEQLDQLLSSQHEGHLALIQVIADLGYMTLPALEKALADFRREYDVTDMAQESEDETELVKKFADFSAAGDEDGLLYDYVGLMLRNVVRFLNDTPFIIVNADPAPTSGWIVSQHIVGKFSLSTGLYMDDRMLLEIASRFYGESLPTVDEMAMDCAGEFLNVHNGVWSSSLSDAGIVVDLLPQFVLQTDRPFSSTDYRIALGTSFGRFEIILSLK